MRKLIAMLSPLTPDGGDGNDIYIYNRGDGEIHIIDSDQPTQTNTLRFGYGISHTTITLELGSLKLNLGNGDIIHIEGFNPDDALNTSSIRNFQFADGSGYSAQQLITTHGFDLGGSSGDDTIRGTSVQDRISGGAGNDVLDGLFGRNAFKAANDSEERMAA